MVELHTDHARRDDQTFARWDTFARQDACGRNLTDERYINRAFDLGLLVNAVPGDLRTYGASLTYRFYGR